MNPSQPERSSGPSSEHARIATSTLGHYDRHADDYWAGTRDHDVRQNIEAMLAHIEAGPPFELLDFGCGPGRDLLTLTRMGHRATGLEGATRPAAMARAWSGCPVLEQNFFALDLPASHFDGVFANASLFHAPGRPAARPRPTGAPPCAPAVASDVVPQAVSPLVPGPARGLGAGCRGHRVAREGPR